MKIKDMSTLDNSEQPEESKPLKQQLAVEYIQPWSNFICKIKLPDEVFDDLQKLYDDASKLNKSFGYQLVGQINNEPEVTLELQNKFANFTQFCLQGVRQYVTTAMVQVHQGDTGKIALDDFLKKDAPNLLTRITTMWFVNQKPGEYNPVHVHTNCKVSAVMYLRKPSRQIKGRKEHYQSDGMITFINNTGTDMNFANAQCSFNPEPGDMYIFPALQHHMVWPYRSEDPNDSRISLSFNADFTTKTKLEQDKKTQEMMYQEMKKHKESEMKNDKSTDVSDINKSG